MSNDVKGGWTPGPWLVESENNPDGSSLIVVDDEGLLICDTCDINCGHEEQAEANARLIASAPELFEALQVLLEFDGISAREKARAALAKAGGATL